MVMIKCRKFVVKVNSMGKCPNKISIYYWENVHWENFAGLKFESSVKTDGRSVAPSSSHHVHFIAARRLGLHDIHIKKLLILYFKWFQIKILPRGHDILFQPSFMSFMSGEASLKNWSIVFFSSSHISKND